MKDYINLIPGESEREGGISKEKIFVLGLILIIIIWGVTYGFKYYEVQKLKKEKTQIITKRDNINKELTAMIEEMNRLSAKGGAVKDRGGETLNLRDLLKERIIWSTVLRELSFLTTPDLWFTVIESRKKKDTDKKEMHFSGNAMSHADVTNFIAAIERSDSFTNINLNFAQQSDLSGQSVINFDVTAAIKRP
ncbi:MAG: PilN domain-containing protein [Nitrospirae bacterium]|nr:PilN domain-containing protein [Nitrospirota bacterium]